MERNALAAVLATLSVGAWGLAAPSSANTDSHVAYHQRTGKFHCTGQVQDDGDGGKVFVEVRGREIRPEDDHFRTARVETRLVVEEKAYHGWEPVKRSRVIAVAWVRPGTGAGSTCRRSGGTWRHAPRA